MKVTKHDLIAADLKAGIKSDEQIARSHSVHPAYVRAVRRREKTKTIYGKSQSPRESQRARLNIRDKSAKAYVSAWLSMA